jgi:hypothetical protein
MRFGWLILVAFAVGAQAQKNPPALPIGTVTGDVHLGDTKRPARAAAIWLVRKPDKLELAEEAKDERTAAERKASDAAAAARTPIPSKRMPVRSDGWDALRVDFIGGRSGMDGAFSIRSVPAGDYYVFATLAGYALPLARVAEDEAEPKLAKIMATVPRLKPWA